LKTLVDARDALAFARREVERVQDSVRAALDQLAVPPASDTPDDGAGPPPSRPPGFLGRLFGRGAARPAVQDEQARLGAAQAAGRVRRSFDSILTGYTMSLQRLERALAQSGLEPIRCLGEPFDPELMEVVEVAADSDRPAHEVVEEVRRGYLWRGRVFRYA